MDGWRLLFVQCMLAGWYCPYVWRVAIGSQEVEHLARTVVVRWMQKYV